MEYNSALKEGKFPYISQHEWAWEHYAKWNEPVTEGQVLYGFTYIR